MWLCFFLHSTNTSAGMTKGNGASILQHSTVPCVLHAFFFYTAPCFLLLYSTVLLQWASRCVKLRHATHLQGGVTSRSHGSCCLGKPLCLPYVVEYPHVKKKTGTCSVQHMWVYTLHIWPHRLLYGCMCIYTLRRDPASCHVLERCNCHQSSEVAPFMTQVPTHADFLLTQD